MWQAIADQISAELQQDFRISHRQQLTTHSGNLLYQIQGQFAQRAPGLSGIGPTAATIFYQT